MNNLKQNPKDISKLQLRYLIKEHQEKVQPSWCSNGSEIITILSKPVLQYSLDGVQWIDVNTVVEKE